MAEVTAETKEAPMEVGTGAIEEVVVAIEEGHPAMAEIEAGR